MRDPVRCLASLLAVLGLSAGCVLSPIGGPSTAPTDGAPPPTASLATSSAVPSFVRPTPTPQPTFLAYVVRRGDNLSAIARRFDTTALSIAYWNRDAYPSLDPESAAYRPDRIETGWTLLVIPGTKIDESDLPEPIPTASATATTTASTSPSPSSTAPAATPTPTATGAAASRKVSHGARDSSMVALTLDMGGRLDPALEIVAWLVDHDVPATIFPTGKTGTTTTVGRQVLQQVVDHPALFTLGNHSWSHPDFRDLDETEIQEQLDQTEVALVQMFGASSRPWFRPPYGGVDARILSAVGRDGFAYTVMWDVDTIDWRPVSDGGPTADQMVDKVVGTAQGGSIVLMHLGGYHTLEALPRIVDGLRAKGLTPVTLEEMFGI